MHEISQKLAVATKPGTWEPSGGWREAELTELRHEAGLALADSAIGQELLEKGGDGILQRVFDVFAERYEGKFPSTAPFVEYLMEVAQDILRTEIVEPPPVAPKPKSKPAPAPAVVLEPVEVPSKVRQFAHMYNEQINRSGCSSVKPKQGFVTLEINDHRYEYLNGEFQDLLEQATIAGLIR